MAEIMCVKFTAIVLPLPFDDFQRDVIVCADFYHVTTDHYRKPRVVIFSLLCRAVELTC